MTDFNFVGLNFAVATPFDAQGRIDYARISRTSNVTSRLTFQASFSPPERACTSIFQEKSRTSSFGAVRRSSAAAGEGLLRSPPS
jgi:hypothetical protein